MPGFRWFAACVLAFVCATGDASAQGVARGRFAGLRLEDALARLQRDGLRLIYTSQIVRADMWVRAEPTGTSPREVLDQLLRPHGLMARDGPGGTVLVVRNPRARDPSPPTPAVAPSPGPPPLAVPTAEAIEALRFAVTVDVADDDATGRSPGTAPVIVNAREISALAGGFENPFRAVQALPGVVGTQELDSRLSVRGGGPDQNLTLLDGIEIHNPFRLRMAADDAGSVSLASTFNAETIRRVELHPAAFDVRYGDRLSSLLLVEPRDGVETAALRGSAFIGLTDANLILEGRLPRDQRGSWLVSTRRGFVDLVPERVTGIALPSFYDLQTRAVWRTGQNQQVTLAGSASRERSRSTRAANPDASQTARTRNGFVALTFNSALGLHASSRTTLSLSRIDDTLDAFERSLDNNRGANTRSSVAAGEQLAFQLSRGTEIDDVSVRQELGLSWSPRHVIDAGAELHRLDTRWTWRISGDRSLLQANGSSIRLGQSLPAMLDSSVDSVRAGAWIQDRWQVASRFALQPGLRVDHSRFTNATTASPRLSGTLTLGSRWRIDAAARLHTQTPGYEKMLQSDYFLDLSSGEGRLRPERAWHFVGGVERLLLPGLSLRLDTYYKRFSDLVVGRLESDEERRARLSSYDVPTALRAYVAQGPPITVMPINGGRGDARGLEVLVSRHTHGGSPLGAWVAYSLGHASRTAYGIRSPFDYDRRHALTAVAHIRIGPRIDVSATGRWVSGLPRTPAQDVRLSLGPDDADGDGDGNRAELVPLRDAAGEPLFQPDLSALAARNTARQPGFGRIDARLTFRPKWGGEHWTLHVDVINILNGRNTIAMDSVLVFDPVQDRPRVVEVPGDRGLPFFPSFGIRYRF